MELKQPIEGITTFWRKKDECGIKEFTLIPKVISIHAKYLNITVINI